MVFMNMYLFDEIESSNPLKQLAEHCLHNRPQSRPHTNQLASTIQVLDRGDETMLPLLMNAVNLTIKCQSDCFQKDTKKIEGEITKFRE